MYPPGTRKIPYSRSRKKERKGEAIKGREVAGGWNGGQAFQDCRKNNHGTEKAKDLKEWGQ